MLSTTTGRGPQAPLVEPSARVRPLVPYRSAFALGAAVMFVSYTAASVVPGAFYVAFAAQLLAVAVGVFLWRGRPELTGWDLIVVSVVAGAGLRSYYFVSGRPGRDVIDYYFLQGRPAPAFLGAAAIYSAALGLVGFGFWFAYRRAMDSKKRKAFDIAVTIERPHLARWAARVIGCASIVALLAFASVSGGFDPANLSAKRAIRLDEIQSTGFENMFRALSFVSIPAAVLHLGLRPRAKRLAWWGWNGLLFALAAVPAVYSSSRRDVVLLAVLLLTVHRLRGAKVRVVAMVAAMVFIFGFFAFVSNARVTADDADAVTNPISMDTLDSLAINRSMIDYTRFANLRAVAQEGRLDYQKGASYVVPFVAPIPRAAWPSKPSISSGVDFARLVYDPAARAGVPPDGLTELYWNFGVVGMVALAPIVGASLGAAEGAARRRLVGNASWFAYSMGPFLLAYRWLTISFSFALTGTLQVLGAALIVFIVAGGRIRFVRRSAA